MQALTPWCLKSELPVAKFWYWRSEAILGWFGFKLTSKYSIKKNMFYQTSHWQQNQ